MSIVFELSNSFEVLVFFVLVFLDQVPASPQGQLYWQGHGVLWYHLPRGLVFQPSSELNTENPYSLSSSGLGAGAGFHRYREKKLNSFNSKSFGKKKR